MANKANKETWTTIPSLPCTSIEETLSFWEMLGFEITYKQTRPYQYGVVRRGGSELHFGRVKGIDAMANNLISGCLVMVTDIGQVYQDFTARLKKQLGKIPNSGIPRISRMKPETYRFTLTDVFGNSIIFIDANEEEKDLETWKKADEENQSPLQKAVATAIRFRDYKEDERAAAKTLDVALRKFDKEETTTICEALVMRIDLAIHMEDFVRADECKALLMQQGLAKTKINQLMRKHNVNL